jgi:hypothetical protein
MYFKSYELWVSVKFTLVFNRLIYFLAKVEKHKRMALAQLQIHNMLITFWIYAEDLRQKFYLCLWKLLLLANLLSLFENLWVFMSFGGAGCSWIVGALQTVVGIYLFL